MVEKEAIKRRTPILQNSHKFSTRDIALLAVVSLAKMTICF